MAIVQDTFDIPENIMTKLLTGEYRRIGSVVRYAVGGCAWIYTKVRNYEPKAVKAFRTAFKTYIEAIRKGKMNIEKINDLMTALEELKKHKDYERIGIQLTTEELEVLVSRIYEYTIKLAKDNFVALTEDELCVPKEANTGAITNLQTYLKVQKRIFESAA